MSILRAALGQARHEAVPAGSPDPFDGRFGPEQECDTGGGRAMYRRCTRCNGLAMVGSLSPHARWCDRDRAASARHNEDHAEA